MVGPELSWDFFGKIQFCLWRLFRGGEGGGDVWRVVNTLGHECDSISMCRWEWKPGLAVRKSLYWCGQEM